MNSLNILIGPDITELVDSRQFDQLRSGLTALEPVDIADLVSNLDSDRAGVVFRLLPRDLAAETFSYLDADQQQALIGSLSTEHLVGLLNEMDPDDRTALFEELPAEVVQRLIALLNPEERRITHAILGYPEESIGRLMTPDYVTVRPEWTVAEAMAHIRKHGRDAETINVIYVVDNNGKLIDDLRIRQLILADPEQTVESLMDHKFIALSATDDREEAVRQMAHYDRVALPVVDSRGMLVGIVTADDIADVAEEEATEDMHKMGGMAALDAPYMDTRFAPMVRKRAGWLLILFLGESLTATALGFFQNELERAVVLALFIPLIVSSGGNAGSQATTLVIRAMAVGEIRLRDWLRVLLREARTGVTLGLILGMVGLLRVLLWPARSTMYGEHYFLLGLTVAASTLGVVTFATCSGAMLPFVLRSFRLDPAAASAPFVATVVDVTGIVIYFGIAALVLRGTLL